jgi:hypothetical protein
MIASLGRYLTNKRRVNVTGMALAGHNQPKKVGGHSPDLEGVDLFTGHPVYGKVEGCDTFASEHTRERLDELSRALNVAVFMVVPASCYSAAKKYVRSSFAGVNITVLSYIEEPSHKDTSPER